MRFFSKREKQERKKKSKSAQNYTKEMGKPFCIFEKDTLMLATITGMKGLQYPLQIEHCIVQ